MDLDAIVAGVAAGKRRPIARLLSLVEDQTPLGIKALQALHDRTGQAHVIGITGSPGTGKSTLTDALIDFYRKQGKTVGVIAVDPSSPFTGGAILGDRIRMQTRSTDPDVFIRSMGSRGHLGGVSAATRDAVRVLDAAGKDIIIVETVGVGQSEVEVVRLADTVVVVLVPGYGDDVQAVKAGLMEIADIFCINKADLHGADKVVGEVEAMMMLGHPDTDVFWWQPIVRTIAERAEGVPGLAEKIAEHASWSQQTGHWEQRRSRRMRAQVRDLMQDSVARFAFRGNDEPHERFTDLFDEVAVGAVSPQEAAERLLALYRSS